MRPGFPQPMAPSPTHGTAASAWRSPIPYLFGGLAAMLGLIAFALLILAFSYWRISGFLDDDAAAAAEADRSSAAAASSAGKPAGRKPAAASSEEGFVVVVMAGDDKPTFLATPRPPPPPLAGSLDSCTGAGKVTGEAAEEEEGKGGEGITHRHQQHQAELDCPSRS
ncbi:protein GLUTAMINE DUMPER 5 [Iris pallida]|uniref:Protein GLUTAMINE DUMPER 5 n=1 Tax=Iris pallida TaxID=29817 RepID=A0AAX6H0C9_IRIPA|nr:protein GLUTAMINE DUMPER 5 [Iris pallida]